LVGRVSDCGRCGGDQGEALRRWREGARLLTLSPRVNFFAQGFTLREPCDHAGIIPSWFHRFMSDVVCLTPSELTTEALPGHRRTTQLPMKEPASSFTADSDSPADSGEDPCGGQTTAGAYLRQSRDKIGGQVTDRDGSDEPLKPTSGRKRVGNNCPTRSGVY
jgi:hypothetical protein